MLKSRSDYRYIGKPVVRKAAVDIVQGKAMFLDDFQMNNLLIAKVNLSHQGT